MRPRKLALALLAATALVAGCGDDDDGGDQAVDESTETTAGTAGPDDAGSLDDDVAAVIDGGEISAASIEGHVEAFAAANPQIAEQIEGADGEVARAQLRAEILSSAVQSSILAAGAEEIGAPVTEEDLEAARTQVEEQAGGEEGLQAAMEQQGLTEDLLQLELRGVAAVENITEVLDEEAGDGGSADTTPEDAGPGTSLTPSEQRVQEFILEQVSSADVRVHPEFGKWDPQSGQVIPPGGAPAPVPGG